MLPVVAPLLLCSELVRGSAARQIPRTRRSRSSGGPRRGAGTAPRSIGRGSAPPALKASPARRTVRGRRPAPPSRRTLHPARRRTRCSNGRSPSTRGCTGVTEAAAACTRPGPTRRAKRGRPDWTTARTARSRDAGTRHTSSPASGSTRGTARWPSPPTRTRSSRSLEWPRTGPGRHRRWPEACCTSPGRSTSRGLGRRYCPSR